MQRKAVITGIGMITPGGTTLSEVWETLLRGESVARPVDSFDVSTYPVTRAGIVKDGDIFTPFSARSLKRMDRFCCLAMAATHRALQDSNLAIQEIDSTSTGIYIGNMYGGWGVTDPSLRKLLTHGYRDVSPYVASAWFPTAPQGQIAIHWGLKGHSKTVVADTASSALSIGYAAHAIEEGRAEIMIAGGAEAPITPYTYAFCVNSGRLNPDGYHAFDSNGSGFLVGEGAVILVLEEMEAAQRRNAHIYAEIAGWASGYLPQSSSTITWSDPRYRFSRLIDQALADASTTAEQVDYLGLDAQGIREADLVEEEALSRIRATKHSLATTCKPTLTHLLGAGAACEIATALLAMEHKTVPPIPQASSTLGLENLRLVTGTPYDADINTALVTARGADGVQAALVLKTVAH